MSRLLVIKGPNLGVTYELGDHARIGRLSENEVQVPDPNVSRMHAEIIKERQAFILHDRGSKNGLLVNGREVAEKVLLRNDEIQIGNTVFLFNSELNIRNARFSNNSVYLFPAQDETLQDARRRSSLSQLEGREKESIDFVLRFADLFAAPPAPLADTCERLAAQIRQLLDADSVIIFLRGSEGSDLQPMVAVPSGTPVTVNRALLHTVAEERHALLTSEMTDPPFDELADAPAGKGTSADDTGNRTVFDKEHQTIRQSKEDQRIPLCMMGAPVAFEEDLMGVIVVEKAELDFYSLRDLGLLQAVCKMAAGTLAAARMADRQLIDAGPAASDVSIIGATRSLRMQEILNAARRTAESNVTVLITGETGTGKEMLARFIHETSPRAKGPFVAINCGAIPGNLFESEIFGYEKGAFTGAARTTGGKVEMAQGGTLFLDEIGELDMALQPKLLRFLQDKAFYRVGGARAVDADVRIIAATNADLAAAVRSGRFREDLWYRLNVVPFHMPPLRERREDIGALLDHLVAKFSTTLNRKVLGGNDSAIALLQKYDWPGNIRELENAVERAVLLAEGKILTTADFAHIEEARRRLVAQSDLERKRETKPLAEIERQHIIIALKKHNYNQARAAEALGLHRNTLRNKVIEYGIDIPK